MLREKVKRLESNSGSKNIAGRSAHNRIYDQDEEGSDYDYNDGFIDDAAEDAGDVSDPDVSQCIRDVFGYDKRKYRDFNDDDIEVADYQTIQREEARSARLAAKEDAEELRKDLERQRLKRLKMAKYK